MSIGGNHNNPVKYATTRHGHKTFLGVKVSDLPVIPYMEGMDWKKWLFPQQGKAKSLLRANLRSGSIFVSLCK